MTSPVVPQAAPLSHIRNVELMHAGTWSASTGIHTFTSDDFAYAVAAIECPAVRRPVLKLGHTDPRFDGQPAVGYIDNLVTINDGHGLGGDYVGMPGWMTAEVLASAYPDRSVEGQWDYKCALGHVHPFVLTGVALLGTTEPAIGTLTSLQDVAALYGVAASAPAGGTPVSVHLKGKNMPNPRPTTVAAGVTTEDVRRAYYDDAPWSVWIEEMHLDPLQLIILDDATGERSRVPIVVSGTDGTEAVTFGDAVPVVIRYEDAASAAEPVADQTADTAVAASILRYANRSESRPGAAPRASKAQSVKSAAGSHPKGGSTVALTLTDEQESALREALGLDEAADGDALVAAAEELATTPEAEASTGGEQAAASAARLPDGVVAIERDVLASLQSDAAQGRAAAERQEREDRERLVDAALRRGAITQARREHWLTSLRADPAMAATLQSLPDELAVPLTEVGHGKDEVSASADNTRDSAVMKNWSI
jgi:hypothetical protein